MTVTRHSNLRYLFMILSLAFVSPALASAPVATPDASQPKDTKKINADEPFVTERQYFTYHGLSSSAVTLRNFKAFNANKMISLLGSNPKAAFDHLGMLILVKKALEGVDIATLTPKDLDRLVEENITQDLMNIGRTDEALALYRPKKGESSKIPSTASMVSLLEFYADKIVRATSHMRPLLSNPNLHTNG